MRILTVAALLMLAAPATALAEPDVVVHDVDTAGVLDYWTPERIAAMPVGDTTPGAPPENGPDGAPVTDPTIQRTVGRLFFVDRGEDSSCTATLVRSANKRTAVTGGHCVHTFNLIREDPQWTSKLLFVPGFRDNTRPYGSYVVQQIVASRTWVADDEKSEHDQAFLVLDKPADAALPIGFGLPGDRPANLYGYPRAARKPGHQGRPEFTGMRAARCWGKVAPDPGSPEQGPENLWGVPCDMGGGSSGGPRVSSGTVVGVNTQGFFLDANGRWCPLGDAKCTRHLGGPQFSRQVTAPLWQRAQTAR